MFGLREAEACGTAWVAPRLVLRDLDPSKWLVLHVGGPFISQRKGAPAPKTDGTPQMAQGASFWSPFKTYQQEGYQLQKGQ